MTGAADAARGINRFMNQKDINFQRDLFALLDLLRPRLGRTWEAFSGELGEDVLVVTYDADAATFVDQNGVHQFHPVSLIAKISGTHRFQHFEARLQVHRDPQSVDDIIAVRWTADQPDLAQEWARGVVESGRLDRIRPRVLEAPMTDVGHCWPWQHRMGLLWVSGFLATSRSQAFGKWVDEHVPQEVLRLLGGRHTYLHGEVIAFFALTNGSTHSDLIDGPTEEPQMSPTLLLVDALTLVVMNWIVTIGLRLRGVSIHAHADDEQVGAEPLTSDLSEALKAVRRKLWEWLKNRLGDDLPLLTERLAWNDGLRFSKSIRGDGDDRVPAELLSGQPPIREAL